MAQLEGYNKEPFGKLVSFFSLTLFHKMLKSQRFEIDLKNEEFVEELSHKMDPLLGQLISFLSSGDSKLMQASLSIVTVVINWPLRCLRKRNKKMLRVILSVRIFIFEKNFSLKIK